MNLLQIDASDRNDTNQMQRLRDRFSTGRSRLESPATFDTPEIEKDNEDAQKQKQIVSKLVSYLIPRNFSSTASRNFQSTKSKNF